jgi:TetR/AcrR family transcriptional regulator, transcriptional repressor of aconitase
MTAANAKAANPGVPERSFRFMFPLLPAAAGRLWTPGDNKTSVRFCKYRHVQARKLRRVPKVSQEHLDSRRAQILEGARRAFAQYGYDGATVTRLEEATGLSRGAIFHYFEDKKELLVTLGDEVSRRYVDAVVAGGFAEAIRELAREDPELLAVLIETEARLSHDRDFARRMEASSAALRPRLEAWIEEQQRKGALRKDLDWREIARFANIVLNGLGLRIVRGEETDVEIVVRLFEDAIRP